MEELKDYMEETPVIIEFWETEEDRDQGLGEVYKYYPESQKEEAIKEAKHLMHLMDYACVEVFNENTEETYYWTDGVTEDLYENKALVTESINEDKLSDEEYELAKYIFNDLILSGSVPDIEEVQEYYSDDITEEQYNKIIKTISEALRDCPIYTDSDGSGMYIELNDNYTLHEIEAPDEYEDNGEFQEYYFFLVDNACKDFEDETGVELKLLGRSGRHACVDITLDNMLNWKELQEVQERLEQEVITNSNKFLAGETESTEEVTESKKSDEAKTGNKAEFIIVTANQSQIEELKNGSAFTWEGMDISYNSLQAIVDYLKENTPNIKLPVNFYTWKGKEFNEIYGLTGSNAYPDDLNFLSIALDNWDGLGNLPIIKMQIGARWLDDIVDNNALRQGNMTEEVTESKHEDSVAEKYGITTNLNKLTNDLMNIQYVTKVDYDLDGYMDNINAPITLVSFDINVNDDNYATTNYIKAKENLKQQILDVMKQNGVNVEMDEFEDNDTYFYIVAYTTNWETNKKEERITERRTLGEHKEVKIEKYSLVGIYTDKYGMEKKDFIKDFDNKEDIDRYMSNNEDTLKAKNYDMIITEDIESTNTTNLTPTLLKDAIIKNAKELGLNVNKNNKEWIISDGDNAIMYITPRKARQGLMDRLKLYKTDYKSEKADEFIAVLKNANLLTEYYNKIITEDIESANKEEILLYNKFMNEIKEELNINWYDILKEGNAIKFRYNNEVYYAEPVSMFQVDIFDKNHKELASGVAINKIKEEVFTDYTANDYIYELVGGDYAGTYTREEAEKLPILEPELSSDDSEIRANGGFTHRKEIDNQLQFTGYLGPMWNGTKDGKAIIRYETQEVYDMLSK